MNNNITEMVFILDRSGSMGGLESDTIGGFNSMINKQKKEEGTALVTAVLFSNKAEFLYDRVDLNDIPKMTEKEYCPRGSTALLDAVGSAIEHTEMIHRHIRKEDVPQNTIFIITTDGLENSSSSFSYSQVKKMISAKEETGWKFIFVGANIDAAAEAAKIGISRENSAEFSADREGVSRLFCGISSSIASLRSTGSISKEWRDELSGRKKRK